MERVSESEIEKCISCSLHSIALFVQMGASLPKGGPAGLFLGFVVYGSVIWCVNQCFGGSYHSPFSMMQRMLTRPSYIAEMVTYLPIASPFIRLGGFWVDDAWGFAMGWNYFFLMGKRFYERSTGFFLP